MFIVCELFYRVRGYNISNIEITIARRDGTASTTPFAESMISVDLANESGMGMYQIHTLMRTTYVSFL